MQEALIIIGTILTVVLGGITLVRYLFYTKTEVDNKFAKFKSESDERDNELISKLQNIHEKIKEELNQTKDQIFEKLLQAERSGNDSRQELYEKLAQNKQIFEEYNHHMLEVISQIKQDEQQTNLNLVQVVNTVKDELKEDYVNRYNELLKLVGTKTNNSDFDRLENKFDKLSQTMTEIKTIVQMQIEENIKRK